jgi:hypothetical protein
MFALPQEIATSVFASVPEELRKKGPRPAWYDERPHAATAFFSLLSTHASMTLDGPERIP